MSAQQEILAVEAALTGAVLNKDEATARQQLADAFVAIGHAGNKADKETYLSIHFSPERNFVRFETTEQSAQVFDSIGLVIGHITVINDRMTNNPPPAYYTAVYHRSGERWQIIAWQETSIQTNPSF